MFSMQEYHCNIQWILAADIHIDVEAKSVAWLARADRVGISRLSWCDIVDVVDSLTRYRD